MTEAACVRRAVKAWGKPGEVDRILMQCCPEYNKNRWHTKRYHRMLAKVEERVGVRDKERRAPRG